MEEHLARSFPVLAPLGAGKNHALVPTPPVTDTCPFLPPLPHPGVVVDPQAQWMAVGQMAPLRWLNLIPPAW